MENLRSVVSLGALKPYPVCCELFPEYGIDLVRGGGLEPPHLSAYAPQTYVSTNSTIRAHEYAHNLTT